MISTSRRDPYEVLGLKPNADMAAIRRAYRALARSLHPDVNAAPDAARRFAEVSHAYALLSDPSRRSRYDAQRSTPPAHARANGRAHGPASRGVLRGKDVELSVHVSLRDSVFGGEIEIAVPRREVCAICVGTGTMSGGSSIRCPRCLGTGGTRTNGDECARCQGSGVIGDPPCANCGGAGRKQGCTTITVALPPDLVDGRRLVLKGDGDVGPRNGPRGDLVLCIVVDPDPVLRRDGCTILMDLTISAEVAAVGAIVAVPTLRGSRRLHVPRGARDGAILRIGGAGVRSPGLLARRGDQLVTIHIAPAAQSGETP